MSSLLKISDAATLALHAMGYMAANTDRLVSTAEIAGKLHVSENHLSKVLQRLSKANLVHSIRGPKGGFNLSRDSATIPLLEIFESIEGHIGISHCLLGFTSCSGACVMGTLLFDINRQVIDYLTNTKLIELTGVFGGKKNV